MRSRTSHAAKSGVGEHTARESEAPNVRTWKLDEGRVTREAAVDGKPEGEAGSRRETSGRRKNRGRTEAEGETQRGNPKGETRKPKETGNGRKPGGKPKGARRASA
jgi:hypothetical protein